MSKSSDTVIKVEGVSKYFKLPHEKHNSLKSKIINVFKRTKGYEVQHALEDINFEVKKGEFFGIVGRNGSGKSTLLKILAEIYKPTKGKVEVKGKLVPFIELGVGFNPELTGRDNVYLSAALLGFSRDQIDKMYSDIVQFAELEKFMDQKLKNYSSGMQVRLAFSIATRAKAGILLIDEVLAVGDTSFQRKCYDYFESLKAEGVTVVFVTHDMSAVQRFCDRSIIIESSKIVAEGSSDIIAKKYSDVNLLSQAKDINKDSSDSTVKFKEVEVTGHVEIDGKKTEVIQVQNSPVIDLVFTIKNRGTKKKINLGTIITNSVKVPIFATNTGIDQLDIDIPSHGEKKIILTIDNIFSNGLHVVSTGIKSIDDTVIYFSNEAHFKFVVGGRRHEYAVASPKYTIRQK